MSPVGFLLLPVVIAVLGCGLIHLLSSWPLRNPSTESSIAAFKREMDTLALGTRHETDLG